MPTELRCEPRESDQHILRGAGLWRVSTAETNRNPTGAVWARRRTESWMRSERAAGGSVSGMRAHSGGMQLAGPGIGMGIGHGPTWHGIGYCLVSLSVGERSGIPQRRSAAHPASTSVRTGRIPKSERDCCIVPHSGHLTAHAQKSRLTSDVARLPHTGHSLDLEITEAVSTRQPASVLYKRFFGLCGGMGTMSDSELSTFAQLLSSGPGPSPECRLCGSRGASSSPRGCFEQAA